MTAVDIILWIVAGASGLVWLLIAVGNAGIAIAWYTRRKRASLVPLIGGVAGVAGMWAVPLDLGSYEIAWILFPAILDIGSIPILVATAVDQTRRAIKGD